MTTIFKHHLSQIKRDKRDIKIKVIGYSLVALIILSFIVFCVWSVIKIFMEL